ncbi:carboxyl transferase domain-containing protein [Imbroritus primus]|uniref:acyl-CoA carboxylase subunit beta n=1 Tax=Imbroritus primus TaxID=3058603 RepID=UPI000269948A
MAANQNPSGIQRTPHAAGDPAWAEQQHAKGRLTAHERLELLLDAGTCTPLGMGVTQETRQETREGAHNSEGVLTAQGEINGRPVCVFVKDMAVRDAAVNEAHARKICRLQEFALESRMPLIGLFDSAGASLEAGMGAVAGYGAMYRNSAAASGVIPQVGLVLGGCPGAEALLPALFDFVFMANDDSSLFVSGPDVVQAITHQTVDAVQLGGAEIHASRSGIADGRTDHDVAAILQLRRFLAFLPSGNRAGAPTWPCLDDAARLAPVLDTLLPDAAEGSYDVRELITQVADEGDFFELQAAYAANIVTGFARMHGRVVGVVANQAATLAGVIDSDAARKAARFVQFCDAFGIAVVTFVDTPGYLPGVAQEQAGLARHAAKLVFAYAQATVPMVTVIVRRALGAAGIAMGSRALGADVVLAWPQARIGLMDARAALALEGQRGDAAAEQAYAQRVLSPEAVQAGGDVHAVIAPRETRQHVLAALDRLAGKPHKRALRSHGNIPL